MDMGKQGPCYHCGVTSTPLWRNGPPEKPILCNACGSRWRTKGSLTNYTPLHARFDPYDHDDHRVAKVKTISPMKKDEKLNKRRLNYDDDEVIDGYNLSLLKNTDDNTSNRSSCGSAISNSETQLSDLTGPSHSIVWDEATVPSKKRTCVIRQRQSSVKKLTKDLCTILHKQASQFSSSSYEELLFESEVPMVSVEIGHGSVLMRHPSSIMGRDSESEASSVSVYNNNQDCDTKIVKMGRFKKPNAQIMHVERDLREKSKHEKPRTMWTPNSPLCHVDLTEIVNMSTFCSHLTADEQQELFKYLPSVDTSVLPESLNIMFSSGFFKESLSSFQQLLLEGILDTSFETDDTEILKRFALSDLMKCKWVEHYTLLKDKKTEQSTRECGSMLEFKSSFSSNLINVKKYKDDHLPPESKAYVRTERSRLAPTQENIFTLHTNGGSSMLNSFKFEDESSNHDLLLDVPPNGFFPEAELLHPSYSSSSIYPAHIYP